MTNTILSQSEMAQLVTDLVGAGTRVIAPVAVGTSGEATEYRPIARLEEAALGGPLPRRPLKEFFQGSSRRAPQVILGSRPCDAAAVERLGAAAARGGRGALAGRDDTTIVTLACPGADRSCFCSAVGLGPDSKQGSDVLLVPAAGPTPAQQHVTESLARSIDAYLQDMQPYPGAAEAEVGAAASAAQRGLSSAFLAEAVTDKGARLLDGRGRSFTGFADLEKAAAYLKSARQATDDNLTYLGLRDAPSERELESALALAAADGGDLVVPMEVVLQADRSMRLGRVSEWLARNPEHDALRSLVPRCRGCGTCSVVCSTTQAGDGVPRRRTERFPDRILRKFCTDPREHADIVCSGCGRCARSCEAGMSLPEVLGNLLQLARSEAAIAS